MLDRPAFLFRRIQDLIGLLRGASPDSSICPCRPPALLILADARRELSTISARSAYPRIREFQRPRPQLPQKLRVRMATVLLPFLLGFGEQGANHL